MKLFLQQQFPQIFASYLHQKGDLDFQGVCTDSRKIKSGDIFIALKGEHFNGSDFILQAIDQGAHAIVCSSTMDLQKIPSQISVFIAEDPLYFYQKMAQAYLATKKIAVIAITGSAGKTSTKEWLADILSQKYHVFKTEGNFNNQIGLPQSILEVRDEQIAIFEIGTGKPGDIDQLASLLNPQIGCITSIGEAHLEFFDSLEHIAQEKWSLLNYTQKGFIPLELEKYNYSHQLLEVINPYEIFHKIVAKEDLGFQIFFDDSTSFEFPFFGEYQLSNLALAVSIAQYFSMSFQEIASTLFQPLPSFRHCWIQINQADIILDCYNANPLSMRKNIETLATFHKPVILILGDMLELGQESDHHHSLIGKQLNEVNSFLKVIFIGEKMSNAYQSYIYKHKEWFLTALEAQRELIQLSQQKVLIFIKGSRGMALEKMIPIEYHQP